VNLLTFVDRLTERGIGVAGESIFINNMPVNCKKGILLRGPSTGTAINHELPGYYKTHFQLIVRAGNEVSADTLMKSAVSALSLKNFDLAGMHVNYCRPRTKPILFPLSQGGIIEATVNMDICFAEQ